LKWVVTAVDKNSMVIFHNVIPNKYCEEYR